MKKTTGNIGRTLPCMGAVLICMFMIFGGSVHGQSDLLVDCAWLNAHQKETGLRIVDVSRNPSSYEKGHIPGAAKVFRHKDLEDFTRYPPVGYPMPGQFARLMKRLGIRNTTTVVAYDDNRNIYAARLIFLLELYGHPAKHLKLLDGGKRAWLKEGMPLEKSPFIPRPVNEYVTRERQDAWLIPWQYIYRKVVQYHDPGIVLVDLRTRGEYTGDILRSVRGGHIPGAVHLDLARAVACSDEEKWKNSKELLDLLKGKGITPDKTIILYCHSGDRSAQAFVILKDILGFPRVRIYEKAWLEWALLQALPVEK